MKNKIIVTGLALCLSSSLYATSFFSNDVDDSYKKFHNELVSFFGSDSFFATPHKYYKLNLTTNYPKMDVFEEKNSYRFKFSLAGIDKKDIKVTITDENILTVSGTQKELSKQEKKDIIRQEQYWGTFSRSISLPEDINSKDIKTKYHNGILEIIVKKDTTKSKKGVRELSID